jgi:thiamine biosynthesis lipoprotein ApbE
VPPHGISERRAPGLEVPRVHNMWIATSGSRRRRHHNPTGRDLS